MPLLSKAGIAGYACGFRLAVNGFEKGLGAAPPVFSFPYQPTGSLAFCPALFWNST